MRRYLDYLHAVTCLISVSCLLEKSIFRKAIRHEILHVFSIKKTGVSASTINQIKIEFERRQRISISFNSNRTDISKHMFTWRHNDNLRTLDKNACFYSLKPRTSSLRNCPPPNQGQMIQGKSLETVSNSSKKYFQVGMYNKRL